MILLRKRLNSFRPCTARLFRSLAGLVLLFALSAVTGHAQSHSASLAWIASTDAAANPTLNYQVYRLNGSCPAVAPTSVAAATGFVSIGSTVAGGPNTFIDNGTGATGLAVGTYCYFVVSNLATVTPPQSAPSNLALGAILIKPPTNVTITIAMAEVRIPPES